MIIVSQDRKRTIENLNLGIRDSGEYNHNYVIYNTEIGEDLGEYKTEERAKEVLQEIISEYKKYATISNVAGNDIRGIYNIPKVYEMPED